MLNTYARRLKEKKLQEPGDPSEPFSSFAEKRRLVFDLITSKFANKLILKKSSGNAAASPQHPQPLSPLSGNRLFYHVVDEQNQKIRNSLELQDPEFLVKQVELILEDPDDR